MRLQWAAAEGLAGTAEGLGQLRVTSGTRLIYNRVRLE